VKSVEQLQARSAAQHPASQLRQLTRYLAEIGCAGQRSGLLVVWDGLRRM